MPMLKLMSVCAAHGSCRFSTTWSQEAPGGTFAKLEVAEPAICSGMRRHRFRYGVRPWSQQIAESIDNKGWFCGCRISTQCSPVPGDGFAAIGAAHGHVAACRPSFHRAQLSHDSGGCAVTNGRLIQQMIYGKVRGQGSRKRAEGLLPRIQPRCSAVLALRPYEPSLLTTLMLRT